MERRRFDAAFKREAVRLITSAGRKASEVTPGFGYFRQSLASLEAAVYRRSVSCLSRQGASQA